MMEGNFRLTPITQMGMHTGGLLTLLISDGWNTGQVIVCWFVLSVGMMYTIWFFASSIKTIQEMMRESR